MSADVTIPSSYDIDTSLSGGVTTTLGGAVTTNINVTNLPKIQLGVDPVKSSLELAPVQVAMRLEKVPDTRIHLPADFSIGLSLLGMQVLCVRLCGEAQVITEPYTPNPCERCGGG